MSILTPLFRGCPRRFPLSSISTLPTPPRSRRITSSTSTLKPRVPLGRIDVKRVPVEETYGYVKPGLGEGTGGSGGRTGGGAGGEGWTGKRSVWRPILFTTSLTATTYLLAALYTNNDTDAWTARLGGGGWWRRGSDLPTDEEMRRAKRGDLGKRLQDGLNSLVRSTSGWSESIQVPLTRVYISLSEAYLHTPSAQLASLGIIGLNAIVFLAWRVPSLQGKMSRYFMHWPVGPNHRVVTLATSVFSHQSLAHFAFNSIALYSFGSAAYTWLSRPNAKDIDAVSGSRSSSSSFFGFDHGPYLGTSTTTPHFLAFFLAAGLASSLTSHLNTVLFRLPRLLRDLSHSARVSTASALAAHSAVLPSLGASGAIYATLTLTSLAFPEASVSLIFLPFVPIKIGYGVAGMLAVDTLGLIRGWRMFDHVAHLSGAAFGFVYYFIGKDVWTWLRIKLGAQERRVRLD